VSADKRVIFREEAMKKSAKNIKTANDEKKQVEEIQGFIEDSKKSRIYEKFSSPKIQIQNFNKLNFDESARRVNTDKVTSNSPSGRNIFKTQQNLETEYDNSKVCTTNSFFKKIIKKFTPGDSPEREVIKLRTSVFGRQSTSHGPPSDRVKTSVEGQHSPLKNRLGSVQFNYFKELLKHILEPPIKNTPNSKQVLVLKPIRKNIEMWNKVKKNRQNFYSSGSLNMPLVTQMNENYK
jgi:hypothetical protein